MQKGSYSNYSCTSCQRLTLGKSGLWVISGVCVSVSPNTYSLYSDCLSTLHRRLTLGKSGLWVNNGICVCVFLYIYSLYSDYLSTLNRRLTLGNSGLWVNRGLCVCVYRRTHILCIVIVYPPLQSGFANFSHTKLWYLYTFGVVWLCLCSAA